MNASILKLSEKQSSLGWSWQNVCLSKLCVRRRFKATLALSEVIPATALQGMALRSKSQQL
jgi:hypothetical protein